MSPGAYAYFSFTPSVSGGYNFTSTGWIDTYGYLYNSDWDVIYQDDDGGENSNFSITYALTAGETYYFGARYYNSSNTGSFTVILTRSGIWVENDDGSRSYQNEDGTLATGWKNIKNDWYYFDANGIMKTGWLQLGSSWYYLNTDGRMAHSSVVFINNKYYYFEESGRMAATVGWIQHTNGDRYYVKNTDGELALGLTTVDDKPYYFQPAMMKNNTAAAEDGTFYLADGDGVVTVMNEGWNQNGDDWYYVKDGVLLRSRTAQIGSAWYGFDGNGRMYSNDQSFGFYDGNTDKWYYYRAKAGGPLYVNSWYKDGNDDWYYYGAEGKALQGLATVGSRQYYFNYDGRMAANKAVSDGAASYYADENGYLTQLNEGWNKQGGAWYYVKDGVYLSNQVIQIGSAWYGFDGNGRMHDDESFYLYGKYYRAKAGGALYVNSWYEDPNYGYWYYYGAEGKAARGVTTVNGKQYYFYDGGQMVVNRVVNDDTASYYADENGHLTKLNEGWNKQGGAWYYVKDGVYLRNQVTQIGSAWYGFSGNYNEYGRMYDDESFYLYGNYYRAKAGGALYVNSWYKSSDGTWYYYGAEGRAAQGLTTVNNIQYYFSGGRMLVNSSIAVGDELYTTDANGHASKVTKEGRYGDYYVSGGKLLKNSWKQIDGKWYYFAESGRAVTGRRNIDGKYYFFDSNRVMVTNAWCYEDYQGGTYYAGASGALLTGEQKIGGKWYYFRDDGVLRTGLVDYNGSVYLCASDGSYIGRATGNGWNQINGSWYYVENNAPVESGVHSINGVNYCFGANGLMLRNIRTDGMMIFGQDGKQIKSGWVQLGVLWYYVDSSTGKYVTGEQSIGGKQYYFDYNGSMQTGEVMVNGEKRVYSASGVLQSKTPAPNGWSLVDGVYYYYENGKPYDGWKGEYYISDGRMLTNTTQQGYWLGKNGARVKNAWVELGYGYVDSSGNYIRDHYYYAKANGKLARNEWLQIGGNWYYFGTKSDLPEYYPYNDEQRMVTGVQEIDGTVYCFDKSGKMISSLEKGRTGWVQVDGNWYYLLNGKRLEGLQRIGNATYAFLPGGRMLTNSTYDAAYFGADGKMVGSIGWNQIDGSWYYYKSSGELASGLTNIGGKTYYFAPAMVTGLVGVYDHDGRYRFYRFGSDGALIETINTQNGWLQDGDDWYYLTDGVSCSSGLHTIDGKVYGFYSTGRLARNAAIQAESNRSVFYWVGSDGTVSRTAGWKQTNYGDWYYTDATGRCLTGIQKINGSTYYFNYNGVWLR